MRRSVSTTSLIALGVTLCALALEGCAYCRMPRIDPSGRSFFVTNPPTVSPIVPATAPAAAPTAARRDIFREMPSSTPGSRPRNLIVCPQRMVAPLGGEVILVASVQGHDQYLRTNEPVQWMLDPAGVGQFVGVDRGSWTDPLVGDFTRARKVGGGYAINSTSRRMLRLTRGTPDPNDDVPIHRGQAWVSITSPVEGTSHVTVFAPNVHSWPQRTKSVQVHWIDAQWSFPSPSITSAGSSRSLSTMVVRQSDGSPRAGWIVRYEISDGPEAGFAPDGAKTIEVLTGTDGRAAVDIMQTRPAPGTNKVAIHVIRPGLSGRPDDRLTVGSGCVLQTWSAADLAVRVTAPAAASAGSIVSYRIEVSNPGDLPADGVVVTADVPAAASYQTSNPPAEQRGGRLRWNVGRLAAGETRTLTVDLRASRPGTIELCAKATAADGLAASACTTSAVDAAELGLQILGPSRATVGDDVTYEIVVTNRSRVHATGLVIRDTFDDGLEHEIQKRSIDRDLGDLAPGESITVGVTFRVAKPGELCHTVEITGAGGVRVSDRACLTASEPAAAAPVTQPPTQPWTTPSAPPTQPPTQPWATPPATRPPITIPPPATTPLGQPEADLPTGREPAPGTEYGDRQQPSKVTITARTQQRNWVGKIATLVVDVSNDTSVVLTDLTVVCRIDPALNPEQATGDYQRRPQDGAFMWTVASLPHTKLARFEIRCRCTAESAAACVHASVSTAQGVSDTAQACVNIGPARATGNVAQVLTIDAPNEPVVKKQEYTYRIRVVNTQAGDDHQVGLEVTLPSNLVPVRMGTFGPTNYKIIGQTIRFEPIETLPAGESVEYRIRVRPEQAGYAVMQAEVTSRNLGVTVVEEEGVEIGD